MSLSTNVSNLATRIATEVKAIRTLVNGNAADLSSLTTTEKSNLVAAVNELKGLLDTAATDITALEGDVGTLSLLTTTDKTDLVSAINELQTEINNIDLSGIINDATTATTTTWSSSKISSEIDAIGTTSNTLDTVVRRDSLTGGFNAGGVNVTALGLDTLPGAVVSSSQGVLKLGNTSQGTNLVGGPVTIDSTSGDMAISSSLGKVDINAATKVNVNAVGNIIINSTGGDAYLVSSTAGNEIATKSYVDTAEADAVASANAYTDSRINDGVTSSSKTWSSTKIESEISTAVAGLVDGAPALLDTLNELAAAIGDDANYATTVTNALSAKANDQAVVHLQGAETIAGVKTFSDSPVVPDSSFAISAITGLQSALDAKASTANVGDTTTNYVTVFEAGLV